MELITLLDLDLFSVYYCFIQYYCFGEGTNEELQLGEESQLLELPAYPWSEHELKMTPPHRSCWDTFLPGGKLTLNN